MAGIEEVRASVALANERVNEALAAVATAVIAAQDAHSIFAAATQGSAQSAVPQGLGMLAQAGENLNLANGNLNGWAGFADEYVSRL
ncbi:hypothetical protein [Actinoalloteichus hymeniacidonis]|uniref:Uncharacterized protein n=1 Tax=Actinoalloteichus hymeniacidonis TaxID=340345 RepID=A0AAC9MZU1_9PSEU|nr:hypothetical protein [Actinoalloteichus hymeniacidonis]AOS65788.1 hypothetical protein TL08_25050 [Actinoalloteichus hymeniacidonis]MBB5906121.1 hypothetical protein [Actinoalloteichus hymeniacidonis]